MANLTLSVDDGILQKAREAAPREHASVNTLVREYLIRCVDAQSRRMEVSDTLDAPAERSTSPTPPTDYGKSLRPWIMSPIR